MSLRKKLKAFIHSKYSPDFLFQIYFNQLNNKKRKRLDKMLNAEKKLVEQMTEGEQKYWQGRIDDVLNGPDNLAIKKVGNAGQLIDNQLVMHNGLLVDPMSYYSFPMLQMLMDNQGVHEPQEEKIFQDVLESLPGEDNKTMLELGSYWSFYSMWFLQKFPSANCFMIEPIKENLFCGKRNFELNEMKGTFIHAGIGQRVNAKNNITTVDSICKNNKIDFLDILHSDIQGYELEMLHGAEKMFSENKIAYVFISTHSNELHFDCQKLLEDKYQFTTVASADLNETYSWDGVLVMKSPNYEGIEKVEIAIKKTFQI